MRLPDDSELQPNTDPRFGVALGSGFEVAGLCWCCSVFRQQLDLRYAFGSEDVGVRRLRERKSLENKDEIDPLEKGRQERNSIMKYDSIQMTIQCVSHRPDAHLSTMLHSQHFFMYDKKVSREPAFCSCATTRLYGESVRG